MSTAAGPRYTSRAEAEKVAYQQGDGVQHRDFGVYGGEGNHGDLCDCGSCTASAAAAAATGPPAPRGRRDFSTVFHRETSAWRANHKHPQSASGVSGGGGSCSSAPNNPAAASTASGSSDAATHGDPHARCTYIEVKPGDVSPGMTYEAYVAHLETQAGMQRLLA
jgi:hypothetical protein